MNWPLKQRPHPTPEPLATDPQFRSRVREFLMCCLITGRAKAERKPEDQCGAPLLLIVAI